MCNYFTKFVGPVNTFRKDLISSKKRTQQAESFVPLKLDGVDRVAQSV
jgi:hypothetical protein